MRLEEKDQIKKRLGTSPDRADALARRMLSTWRRGRAPTRDRRAAALGRDAGSRGRQVLRIERAIQPAGVRRDAANIPAGVSITCPHRKRTELEDPTRTAEPVAVLGQRQVQRGAFPMLGDRIGGRQGSDFLADPQVLLYYTDPDAARCAGGRQTQPEPGNPDHVRAPKVKPIASAPIVGPESIDDAAVAERDRERSRIVPAAGDSPPS